MRLSPKINNIALLVGGYLSGQGSLFLSQSWLLTNNEVGLLATFGICFSVAGLVAILVDFGLVNVLARSVAISGGYTWSMYWAAVATRTLPTLAMISAVAGWLFWSDGSAFSKSYALFALPGLLAWSFNMNGILDGLRLSGVNGVAAAFPFLLSSIALVAVGDASQTGAGALLGGAFSLGYVGALALQILVLWRRSDRPTEFSLPSFGYILSLVRPSAWALLTTLPGQVYFRAQLAICAGLLGDGAVALLIYCKQIVTAFLLLASFLRRVEFPDLARALVDDQATLRLVFRMQMGGSLFGFFGFLGVLVASVIATGLLTGPLGDAARNMTLFSILILSGTLSSAAVQGLLAVGRFGVAAATSALASVLGVAFSLGTVAWLGIAGFVLADLVGNLASGAGSAIMLGRRSSVGERGL